jgi:hypothetical protein
LCDDGIRIIKLPKNGVTARLLFEHSVDRGKDGRLIRRRFRRNAPGLNLCEFRNKCP